MKSTSTSEKLGRIFGRLVVFAFMWILSDLIFLGLWNMTVTKMFFLLPEITFFHANNFLLLVFMFTIVESIIVSSIFKAIVYGK